MLAAATVLPGGKIVIPHDPIFDYYKPYAPAPRPVSVATYLPVTGPNTASLSPSLLIAVGLLALVLFTGKGNAR